MNNDLKNFLEEERSGVLTIGDRILVNKVLDLVEKEVEKKEMIDSVPFTDGTVQEFETGLVDLQDISTIINNLRV